MAFSEAIAAFKLLNFEKSDRHDSILYPTELNLIIIIYDYTIEIQ
ncbi:MAG: hypothetical protein V7K14_02925 [Nostoc sp.]